MTGTRPAAALRLDEAFAGRTLLVTGATGFLAKAFVAKVARDLPGVDRIALLLRPRRRGKTIASAQDRLHREVLGSSAFRSLRAALGDDFDARVASRLFAVEGDLSVDGLGLDERAREALSSVDAIVHSAATVVFDEQLDQALELNTFGAHRLLALARSLGDVPLLHVSTAYACGQARGLVPEEPPPLDRVVADDLEGRAHGTLDLDEEIANLRRACADAVEESRSPDARERFRRAARRDADPEEGAEQRRRSWVKQQLVERGMAAARQRGWNDTYTYTKSLGERLVVRDRGSVPVALLRPAIIESGLAEPEPGWIDGLRMADPLFAAYGRGVLRAFPGEHDALIDFIPVDHVANSMVAALGRLLEARAAGPGPTDVAVYHVATSTANPLSFGRLFELTREYFAARPLAARDGRPARPAEDVIVDDRTFAKAAKRRVRAIAALGAVADKLPGAMGRNLRQKVGTWRAQLDRILYYVAIYRPYCAFHARFDTRRTEELFASLEPADRARFPFDPRSFTWPEYLQEVHLPGLVRNVLRETPAEALPQGESGEASTGGRGVFDLLADAARVHGDRVALQVRREDGWRRWTYRDLLEQALGGASALRAAGVRQGDTVLLQSENRPEWVVSYFALMAAGATAVPLDAQSQGARVAEVARIVDAAAALLSPKCADAFPAGTGLPVVRVTEIGRRPLEAARAAREGLPAAPSPEAPASILFTSGTVLAPKGVVLPHRAFVANVEGILSVLQPGPDDRLVSVLPLHHAFEFTAGMLAPLAAGASITYLETTSSEALLGALRETQATVLLGVPRLYELLLDGIDRQASALGAGSQAAFGALRGASRAFSAVGLNAGRTLMSPVHQKMGGAIRVLVSGGAALPARVHDEFHALGFTLCEGYGLTETAPVLTVNPPSRTKAGSVGPPLPGVELKVHAAGADGVGEILARGPNVMTGYYKDPAATAAVLRGGWFHTGDLGRFDEDGYLHVTGRLKDLIVTGAGKNVYPDEVESEMAELPGVREHCVVGVRARTGAGEEVHLVVVPEADTDESREAIQREVAARSERLDSHQRIQRIHFWSGELPKTRLLKVRRGEVRERLEGHVVAPAAARAADSDHPVVREVLALLARLARVPVEGLGPEQNLAFDLGVDSLMRVEIVSALEARTSRRIAPETALELTTVGDLCDLARELAGASPRPRDAEPDPAGDAGPAGAPRGRAWTTRAPVAAVRAVGPAFYERWLRLEVFGREHVPTSGPYLLAANHASHLDAGAVLVALGEDSRRLRVVAAQDYFFDTGWKSAFFGELFNAIPFDRHGDFGPGLEACRKALEEGDPLLIFPEGTRSVDGRLQPFKAGLGVLAVELGVPVVPIRIDGTHAALPKGARVPRRRRVRVTFGEPLDVTRLGAAGTLPYERYREVVEAVRHRIASLDGEHAAITGRATSALA